MLKGFLSEKMCQIAILSEKLSISCMVLWAGNSNFSVQAQFFYPHETFWQKDTFSEGLGSKIGIWSTYDQWYDMKYNCVKKYRKSLRYNLLNLFTLLMTQSLEG